MDYRIPALVITADISFLLTVQTH